jgi:chemotaxis methyl-accepting protein methylase
VRNDAGGADGDAGPLESIRRLLVERQGLDLSRYKATYLRRRLLVRVRALRLDGMGAYARHLKRHPDEIGPLLKALSIQVTGFFRNRSCFEFLEERIVPELLGRSAGKPVAVWSAGCATGQEAWSLAAIFAGAAGARPERRVRITATDLDAGALERARRATYPAKALLADVPAGAARHFETHPDGTAGPDLTLRRMVSFQRESLLDPAPRRDLDLILCRNVLIYFGLDQQEAVLSRFADALAPSGYLVLGRVERLLGAARSRFEVVSARDRIYRTPPADAAARPPAPPRGAACA